MRLMTGGFQMGPDYFEHHRRKDGLSQVSRRKECGGAQRDFRSITVFSKAGNGAGGNKDAAKSTYSHEKSRSKR